MQRVRLKKVLTPHALSPPTVTIIKDGFGRHSTMQYDFVSFRVKYTVIWEGDTSILVGYSPPVITDQP